MSDTLPPCPHGDDESHGGLGKAWCMAGREGEAYLAAKGATFHGADSVAKRDARYPTPEEEYAWAEGQRYDYLDVLRQRDQARAALSAVRKQLTQIVIAIDGLDRATG